MTKCLSFTPLLTVGVAEGYLQYASAILLVLGAWQMRQQLASGNLSLSMARQIHAQKQSVRVRVGKHSELDRRRA